MIRQPSTNSVSADTRAPVCVDEEPTADLPFESTRDLPMKSELDGLDSIDSAAAEAATTRHDGTAASVDAPPRPVRDPSERSSPQMPKQRGFGFFAFVACAVIATLAAVREPEEPCSESSAIASQVVRLAPETQLAGAEVNAIPKVVTTAEESSGKGSEPEHADLADASVGRIAFQSRSFVTSEQATAAVVILKRTRSTQGRAQVRWAARTGSADAGIDFSDAAGVGKLADGQRQVAIYIPLRNDLTKEEDETFQVCLSSPQQVRIAGRSCTEVTILDDDQIGAT